MLEAFNLLMLKTPKSKNKNFSVGGHCSKKYLSAGYLKIFCLFYFRGSDIYGN